MTDPIGRRILVVGDVIDDIIVVPSGPIQLDTDTPSTIRRVAGGSAANTAAWLGSLGADVVFVGAVGVDDVERHTTLLPGVDARLQAVPTATGTIVVVVDGEQRSMLTDRGANAQLDFGAIDDVLLSGHVHVTGHTMAADDGTAFAQFIARSKDAGATVSVSPGSAAYIDRLGRERFAQLISGADVLFVSLAEGQALTGLTQPEHVTAALSFETVVLTLGGEGVLVNQAAVPPTPAVVVDPTGAGDAFCAGFLFRWVAGADAVSAAAFGTRIAAAAVSTLGARPA